MSFRVLLTVCTLTLLFVECAQAELRQVAELKNQAFDGSNGHQLACSPDGKLIAVGSYGIGIWNAQTGTRLQQLKGHPKTLTEGGVTGLVFTEDSRTLISCGHDGAIRFWEASTGKLSRELTTDVIWLRKGNDFPCGPMPLHALAYSARHQIVTAVGHDWSIRLWNSRTGEYLGTVGKPRGEQVDVKQLSFKIPDDFDLSRYEFVRMPVFYQDRHPNLCFAPDGRTLAATDSDQTCFWDAVNRKQQLEIPGGGAGQFSPDGRWYVTGNYDGMTVWNPRTGKKIREISNATKVYSPLQFSPDGWLLVTGSADSSGLRIWDFTTGTLKKTIPCGSPALDAIRFTPDGKRIAATVRLSQVHLFDLASGQKLFGNAHTATVDHLTFAANGRYLISGGADSAVKAWDTQTWKLRSSFTRPELYVSALYSFPDADQVFVGDRRGNSRLLQLPSLEPELTLQHGNNDSYQKDSSYKTVSGYAFSDQRLFVGMDVDQAGWIETWDWKTRTRISTQKQHATYHLRMAASRDQSIVATTDYGGNVVIWENSPQQRIGQFQIDGKHTSAVAVRPDGKQIATCGRSGPDLNLQIWETHSQKEITRLRPGGSGITAMAWSPDGSTLAIASMGSPGLYLYRSGQLSSLDGTRGCHSLAFSPDGQWIATGLEDGSIEVWEFAE
ncbi:WD40 repeat domain-containing protein [Gimesia panareensis]|uniref:Translocation protein TolB n=1 Tax=Gimesia panareensis TaxID=2527978 RepID=A0A518A6X5_9PLAN|nr:WD40 repeat domain-containing protein [Gimesia panareensis]QDT26622.1 translocation protein TolB [Gimesia panareensis]QDU50469.1 translocation protein TolB [Gimesia panareensis]